AMFQSKEFPNLRGHIRLKSIQKHNENFIFGFRKLLYNTSYFINEINPFYRLVVQPPGELYINGENYHNKDEHTFDILTNGRPEKYDFDVIINEENLDEDLVIILQIGGEKSPSKLSMY